MSLPGLCSLWKNTAANEMYSKLFWEAWKGYTTEELLLFFFNPPVFALIHSFPFIHIAKGMSIPLILTTWWAPWHASNNFMPLLSQGWTFPGCQKKVSEGEKALARSSPEMGWHQQYLSLSFQDYDVQLYMCEARGAGNVLHSINICAGCSARHCGRCKDDCDTVPDLKVLLS